MTEPSGLEYCVRDRETGRIVVAWRPVEEVVAAVDGFGAASARMGRIGLLTEMRTAPASAQDWGWRLVDERRALDALLGLEPAADADDVHSR